MPPPPAPLPPEVQEALNAGRLIEAIKLLRKARGFGLAEAKAALEAHMRGAAAPQPKAGPAPRAIYPTPMSLYARPSPGEVPRTGSGAWVVMVLIAAALVAWLWLK